MKKIIGIVGIFVLIAGLFAITNRWNASAQSAEPDPNLVSLGKALFFDTNLSVNGTQSCATCHAAEVGFTGPDSLINQTTVVYQGALPNHFGNRKPPASAYAGDSPILFFDEVDGGWFGGMFWDGRATGRHPGDPLAEQAQGPFLNPLEQAIANAQVLCVKVKQADYAGPLRGSVGRWLAQLRQGCGRRVRKDRPLRGGLRAQRRKSTRSLQNLTCSGISRQAAGKDVTKIKCGMGGGGMGGGMGGGPWAAPAAARNGWTSYRNLGLTDAELQGLAVFNDPNRADCASCHSLAAGPDGYPLFTDFGYDNIGIPKNPENPFYSACPKPGTRMARIGSIMAWAVT